MFTKEIGIIMVAKVIEITDNNYLACGNCFGVLHGYDEVICPCCSITVDMDDEVQMTEEDLLVHAFDGSTGGV